MLEKTKKMIDCQRPMRDLIVFEKKIEDMRATGYIVELNECSIRHSKQEEVTFK